MIRRVNYELYMGEALAEAQVRGRARRAAPRRRRRPGRGDGRPRHDRVHESDDPTAHAVVLALREAARRVGKERLRDVTIFCTMEPCPMCVGALLASDVEALVFAVPNRAAGAAGTISSSPSTPRCGAASRSSAASAATRSRSSTPPSRASAADPAPNGTR